MLHNFHFHLFENTIRTKRVSCEQLKKSFASFAFQSFPTSRFLRSLTSLNRNGVKAKSLNILKSDFYKTALFLLRQTSFRPIKEKCPKNSNV